jgi:hypothetical protein
MAQRGGTDLSRSVSELSPRCDDSGIFDEVLEADTSRASEARIGSNSARSLTT